MYIGDIIEHKVTFIKKIKNKASKSVYYYYLRSKTYPAGNFLYVENYRKNVI